MTASVILFNVVSTGELLFDPLKAAAAVPGGVQLGNKDRPALVKAGEKVGGPLAYPHHAVCRADG